MPFLPPGVRTWTRTVPGLPGRAGRLERVGALADDPRNGRQGLDVVDEGRPVEQAALGRVRRALLGLAALALERLEQDGLLAEHVRALDRPDGDVDVVARARHVRAEEARIGRGADGRRQARDDVGVLGADRDERLARADGVGRDGRALEHGVRVQEHERAVGVRGRVGAVAVGDDVAPVGVGRGRGPPLVAGRVAGAAAAAQARLGDRRR